MNFKNKVVLITGASAGIGAATAILFAERGADVAIVGRNEANLNSVAEQCSKIGNKPLVITADITKNEEVQSIIQRTVDAYGRIDVLVNNAGIIKFAGIFDANLMNIYDDVMATNLRAAVYLTNLAAPYLAKTKGNVVNLSSIGARKTLGENFISYCLSKAGMDRFTQCAAFELAALGVRVNAISPGPIKTGLLETGGFKGPLEQFEGRTALGKLGTTEDVARLILFVASDEANSSTGSIFTCDNGILLK